MRIFDPQLPMYLLIALVFIVGYACIALEHPLKVNKAAPALLTGMIVWSLIMFMPGGHGHDARLTELSEHLSGAGLLRWHRGVLGVVALRDLTAEARSAQSCAENEDAQFVPRSAFLCVLRASATLR